MERPFRTPFVPVAPIVGIVTSLYLVFMLPRLTKEVVFGWLLIGLVVYFTYSIRNSNVQAMERAEKKPVGPAAK